MTARRLAALVVASLALAGCAGAERGADSGSARLWITRDRGATLVLDARVPAGQTLMRALRSRARVETRYGGRFVQAIDGVQGSLSRRHDWFWFVNGLAGATSAVEYRLHAGDVAWWDYRDWTRDPDLAVVVGAFPEPFLHGFGGRTRPVDVRYVPGLRAGASAVGRLLHAASVAPLAVSAPRDANLFVLVAGPARFVAAQRTPGAAPSSPVRFTFAGDVRRLLGGAYARRFALP